MTTFRIDFHDAASPYRFMFSEEVEADTLEEAVTLSKESEAEINKFIGPGRGTLTYGVDEITGQPLHGAHKVFVGTVISA